MTVEDKIVKPGNESVYAPPLKEPVDSMQLILHYVTGATIFAIYGVAVCPFVESLSYLQLLLPIFSLFLVMYLTRSMLWQFRIRNNPMTSLVKKVYTLDLILFGTAGLLLAMYNFLIHDFPAESGGKIIIGMLSLGWFIAIDIALHNEHIIARQLKQSGMHIRRTVDYLPLSKKFSLFALATVTIIAIVLLLVVRKDLHWLAEQSKAYEVAELQQAIVYEFLFVLVVMLAYLLKIISSYAKNSNFFLANQNETLQSVADGNLRVSVPVASNDEFGEMAQLTNKMIHDLQRQNKEIKATRDTTILALSSLAETRDNETGAHILRTQHYVRSLCRHLKKIERYQAYLTDERVDLLYKSAPLHDIGKVGIPDKILLKPDRLTDDEFEIMKTHTSLGKDAIDVAEEQLGANSFLSLAKEIAANHHEKWDGSGYPLGLKEEQIPLPGRLMAVADVYDALISKRVYKPAFSHEKAREIILDGSGSHFDPNIVEAFVKVEDEFIAISQQYKDSA